MDKNQLDNFILSLNNDERIYVLEKLSNKKTNIPKPKLCKHQWYDFGGIHRCGICGKFGNATN